MVELQVWGRQIPGPPHPSLPCPGSAAAAHWFWDPHCSVTPPLPTSSALPQPLLGRDQNQGKERRLCLHMPAWSGLSPKTPRCPPLSGPRASEPDAGDGLGFCSNPPQVQDREGLHRTVGWCWLAPPQTPGGSWGPAEGSQVLPAPWAPFPGAGVGGAHSVVQAGGGVYLGWARTTLILNEAPLPPPTRPTLASVRDHPAHHHSRS